MNISATPTLNPNQTPDAQGASRLPLSNLVMSPEEKARRYHKLPCQFCGEVLDRGKHVKVATCFDCKEGRRTTKNVKRGVRS